MPNPSDTEVEDLLDQANKNPYWEPQMHSKNLPTLTTPISPGVDSEDLRDALGALSVFLSEEVEDPTQLVETTIARASLLRCSINRALGLLPALKLLEDLPPAAVAFLFDVAAEVAVARARFPGDNLTTIALGEEYGEAVKATLDEPSESVWKETRQTAAMACRLAVEGDFSVNEWRETRALDPITSAAETIAEEIEARTKGAHSHA